MFVMSLLKRPTEVMLGAMLVWHLVTSCDINRIKMNMSCGVKLSSVRSRLHVSWWHLQILTCTNLHHIGGSWSFTSGPHLAVWVLPWLVAGRCSFFVENFYPNRCTRINWFLAELQLARAATSTLRPSCFFATLSPMNRSKSGECAYQKSTTQNMRTRGLSPKNPLTIWKILMHSSHAHCAISRGWSATTASAARCSSAAIERYWKLWNAGGEI